MAPDAVVVLLVVVLALPALALLIVSLSYAIDAWLNRPFPIRGLAPSPHEARTVAMYDRDADDVSVRGEHGGPAVIGT